MLSSVFLKANSVESILAGPIGAHAEAFAGRLGSVGYRGKTVQKYVSVASHFGGWLRKRKIEFEDVDETTILAFRRHLPKCRCLEWYHGRYAFNGKAAVTAARHFLEYLRAEGIARPRVAAPVPPLMAEFSNWLRQRQSVGDKTAYDYRRHSEALLATIDRVENLDARAVRAFIMAESRKFCRGYVAAVITAIKAFIRFLTVTERCSSNLKDAIPKSPSGAWPRFRDISAMTISNALSQAATGVPLSGFAIGPYFCYLPASHFGPATHARCD